MNIIYLLYTYAWLNRNKLCQDIATTQKGLDAWTTQRLSTATTPSYSAEWWTSVTAMTPWITRRR